MCCCIVVSFNLYKDTHDTLQHSRMCDSILSPQHVTITLTAIIHETQVQKESFYLTVGQCKKKKKTFTAGLPPPPLTTPYLPLSQSPPPTTPSLLQAHMGQSYMWMARSSPAEMIFEPLLLYLTLHTCTQTDEHYTERQHHSLGPLHCPQNPDWTGDQRSNVKIQRSHLSHIRNREVSWSPPLLVEP